jgi:hypothetical protein
MVEKQASIDVSTQLQPKCIIKYRFSVYTKRGCMPGKRIKTINNKKETFLKS